MVTMPSRGSFTCISRVEATTSRIRTASLRARATSTISVVLSVELLVGGQHLDLRVGGDEPLAGIEDLDAVLRVGRHDRDPDEGPPVQVQMTRLGGAHVVVPLQLGDDRA